MDHGTHLGDDEVSVVQRSTVKLDQNIILAHLFHWPVLVDKSIEPLVLALNEPLLLCRWCHFSVAVVVVVLEISSTGC